jgi:hypothetical protein
VTVVPDAIYWHSNGPLAPTGYGQQTAQVTRRLRDAGYDVSICAFYGQQAGMSEWEGIPIFPTDSTHFAKTMLPFYVGKVAGDGDPRDVQVITLMDVWALNEAYKSLAAMKVACWTPVDHDPLPPRVAQFFALTDARPIAMSRFGEEQLERGGFDPLYVPHAIDTAVFRPLPEERVRLRAELEIPPDAFVVGMVANNQGDAPPRKSFPQLFQAFRIFLDEHVDEDVYLYLHCDLFGFNQGIHLLNLAEIVGIPHDRIVTTDQLDYHLGLPQERLAGIYSTFDVLAAPSMGEGFGIPIIEAQACGVPVIVTNWTSMPELTGAGWLVEGDTWYDPPHGSFYMNPSIIEIEEALEAAYEARGDRALRERARTFALDYDCDVVFRDFWVPALADLSGYAEVGPLDLRPAAVEEAVA